MAKMDRGADARIDRLCRRDPPDVHMRLVMYKRIANTATEDGLKKLKVEGADKLHFFRPMEDPAQRVAQVTQLVEQLDKHRILAVEGERKPPASAHPLGPLPC
jgi:transcription-repair coupling factor (superfamily II helicase)